MYIFVYICIYSYIPIILRKSSHTYFPFITLKENCGSTLTFVHNHTTIASAVLSTDPVKCVVRKRSLDENLEGELIVYQLKQVNYLHIYLICFVLFEIFGHLFLFISLHFTRFFIRFYVLCIGLVYSDYWFSRPKLGRSVHF